MKISITTYNDQVLIDGRAGTTSLAALREQNITAIQWNSDIPFGTVEATTGGYAVFDATLFQSYVDTVQAAFVAEDNTPPPAPTYDDYMYAAQQLLDSTVQAQPYRYDNIVSACSYTVSGNAKFQAEAEACVAWRDQMWLFCNGLMAQVSLGQIPQPTVAEFYALLPRLVWPVVQ